MLISKFQTAWPFRTDNLECSRIRISKTRTLCNKEADITSCEDEKTLGFGRRQMTCLLTIVPVVSSFVRASSVNALPLAPLGKIEVRKNPSDKYDFSNEKYEGLPIENVVNILVHDIGESQYFVTGDLTPEIFDDNCRFIDPTNETRGLSRYRRALAILFDPQYSITQLKDIRIIGPHKIQATWILGGYLRLPWHPRVEPFTGVTVYSLNDRGLIEEQRQTWSISALEALKETFTPTAGIRNDIKDIAQFL